MSKKTLSFMFIIFMSNILLAAHTDPELAYWEANNLLYDNSITCDDWNNLQKTEYAGWLKNYIITQSERESEEEAELYDWYTGEKDDRNKIKHR